MNTNLLLIDNMKKTFPVKGRTGKVPARDGC
jgi:hypothetical protein